MVVLGGFQTEITHSLLDGKGIGRCVDPVTVKKDRPYGVFFHAWAGQSLNQLVQVGEDPGDAPRRFQAIDKTSEAVDVRP